MNGVPGNDYYFVGESRDSIKEAVGKKGGKDTVEASISYKLPNNVENLILTGSEALDGTGNKGANQLTGNDGSNLLDGLNGKDKLFGLGGNDYLDGGVGSDCLDGGAGDDILFGYGFSNKEIDTLIGGIGSDIFVLGEEAGAFYNRNGDLDYAVIKDFDPALDMIDLNFWSDSADNLNVSGYNLVINNGNTELRTDNDELIAVIEGVTDFSLTETETGNTTLPGGNTGETGNNTLPGGNPEVPIPGPREIADSLWDAGKTMGEIGAELKDRGFDLPTIADAVNIGITKSDGSEVTGTDTKTS
jgi:hypothetical protein